MWRYKISCVTELTPEEHGAVIASNIEEGWELVTVYETQKDWRFVFRRLDESKVS